MVHSAALQDRVAARAVMIRLWLRFSAIRTIIVEGAYTGKLIGWAKTMLNWTVTVIKRTPTPRFSVLPQRWIVERTFAWLSGSRRLSKDYEICPHTAETFIKISMLHILIKRLARI
jgi:transposase